MLFDRKRNALKYAAIGITMATIPGVNIGVAMAAVMANDANRMDEFEKGLQSIVCFSAFFWLPALFIMPFALAYLAMNSVVEHFENASNNTAEEAKSFAH